MHYWIKYGSNYVNVWPITLNLDERGELATHSHGGETFDGGWIQTHIMSPPALGFFLSLSKLSKVWNPRLG